MALSALMGWLAGKDGSLPFWRRAEWCSWWWYCWFSMSLRLELAMLRDFDMLNEWRWIASNSPHPLLYILAPIRHKDSGPMPWCGSLSKTDNVNDLIEIKQTLRIHLRRNLLFLLMQYTLFELPAIADAQPLCSVSASEEISFERRTALWAHRTSNNIGQPSSRSHYWTAGPQVTWDGAPSFYQFQVPALVKLRSRKFPILLKEMTEVTQLSTWAFKAR